MDPSDLESAWRLSVSLAVRVVHGADAAALSLLQAGEQGVTAAASDLAVRHADELQHELGEGPALSAPGDEGIVQVRDARRDGRWPAWSYAVGRRSGYQSVLVATVCASRERACTLDLYSSRVDGFDDRDVEDATALVAHLALTLGAVREVADLRRALDSRTVLGQATGILMERYRVDADHALTVITRLSSHGNRKMRDVAREIATTGSTAGLARPPGSPLARKS